MKRILCFLLVLVMMLSVASFTGCDSSEKPMSVYQDGIKAITSSNGISYVFDFAFGDTGYKMTVDQTNDGAKYVEFSADESDMKVYVNGAEHYYDIGDIKYKVAADDDSVIMQELLDFEFFHGEASMFTKEIFEKVEFVSVNDNEKYIELKLSGEELKKAIAPDEDVSFSETSLKISFDGENSITEIEFATVADGKEFYGLPVGDNKEMTASYKINNVGDVNVEEPSDDEEWEEMPAMAILTPAALAYRKSMGMDVSASINIDMMGMSFSIPMEISTRSQIVDGKTLTRTVTKMNADIMGQTMNENSDVFTDGNGDYEYYTDSDGNYKVNIEENKDEDNQGSAMEDLQDPEILKNAKIKKSGENTVITVELTNELLNSLLSSDLAGDMSDMTGESVSFDDSELVIVVSSSGYIVSAEMKMSASQKINEPTLGMEYDMSMSVKMDITFLDPNEEITVDIPDGYLDYPLLDESI